jgi:hypothetical protein
VLRSLRRVYDGVAERHGRRTAGAPKALAVALSFCRLLGLGCPKQAFAKIATPRFFRAKSHKVFEQDGEVFAQKTTVYLLIWAVAYGLTQLIGIFAKNYYLLAGGLLTGVFSTAMLLIVTVLLLHKRTGFTSS